MCVDRCVSRSSGQILTVAIWDMLSSFRVTETLSQTKVDHVDIMLFLADTDQEVVWLDVSVKEMAGVDKLNAL